MAWRAIAVRMTRSDFEFEIMGECPLDTGEGDTWGIGVELLDMLVFISRKVISAALWSRQGLKAGDDIE
jgi:hypothetical protein